MQAVQPAPHDTSPPRAAALRRNDGAGVSLRVFTLLAVLHAAAQLFVFLPSQWGRTDAYRDATYTYVAAGKVQRGEPLYRPWPEYGPHVLVPPITPATSYPYDRNPYPPVLAPLLSWVASLPYLTFARGWLVALAVAFWVYAACLAKLAAGRVTTRGVLVAGMAVGVTPGAYRALELGNPDPFLWALFGLACAYPAVRGAGFVLAGAVKLYAVWPLLLAWRIEGRRVILQSLAVGIALLVIAAAVMGPADHAAAWWEWRHMLPVIGQGTFRQTNFSLSMLGLRAARWLGWEYLAGPLPLPARLYLSVWAVGAPLLAVWLTRKRDPVLRYGIVTCAAVAFAPLAWVIYLPLVLAPAAILYRPRLQALAARQSA